jgi:glycerol-3-phosphate cytidylyltransferase-like family protein
MSHVTISGSFDDLRAPQVRELADQARSGKVHLLLWSDELFRQIEKHDPKFPLVERQYSLESIRYVDQVSVINEQGTDLRGF